MPDHGERGVTEPPARVPTALVAVVLALPPLCTDMHLAAYPAMAADLVVGPASIQATFTVFIIAFAVGQLTVGPFSDATGRRLFLLGGGALFAVASVAASLAPDATTLLIARTIQGLAGAAMVVAARAAVTDLTTGTGTARSFASIVALTALAPVIAPVLGTIVLTLSSWRLIFAAQALIGAIVVIGVLLRLPETLPVAQRGSVGLGATLARMGDLLRLEKFAWHVAAGSIAAIGFYTYINAASFIIEVEYNAAPAIFATMFATNALGMVGVILVVRLVINRVPLAAIFGTGLALCTTAALLLGALTLAGAASLPAVWVCFALTTAGWGCVIPTNLAIAQIEGRRHPATAAALQGGMQFGIGGLATPLSGLMGATVAATATIMVVAFSVAVMVFIVGVTRRRRHQA